MPYEDQQAYFLKTIKAAYSHWVIRSAIKDDCGYWQQVKREIDHLWQAECGWYIVRMYQTHTWIPLTDKNRNIKIKQTQRQKKRYNSKYTTNKKIGQTIYVPSGPYFKHHAISDHKTFLCHAKRLVEAQKLINTPSQGVLWGYILVVEGSLILECVEVTFTTRSLPKFLPLSPPPK